MVQVLGETAKGWASSSTAAQAALRLANTTTSFSPFSQGSARLVRTGSAAVRMLPVVLIIFALGNIWRASVSALVPALIEKVTSGLLSSAAVFHLPTLSLWISARLPRAHRVGTGNSTAVARGTV